MPKTLTIGTQDFEIPLEGENGNYGEQISDWCEAVTDALGTVQQRNDIPTTTASILNNRTSATSVTGFLFDTSEVISINSEFIVTRTTDSPAVQLVESGFIQGNFDGSNWNITITSVGNSGVSFDMTAGGQVTYTSTNMTGTNYTGEIRFKAKVFNDI